MLLRKLLESHLLVISSVCAGDSQRQPLRGFAQSGAASAIRISTATPSDIHHETPQIHTMKTTACRASKLHVLTPIRAISLLATSLLCLIQAKATEPGFAPVFSGQLGSGLF